tara:strand:+ start:6040 stop:6270 length:231 start_codon:yes stop_codon:yes gene_type:complete
MAKREVRQDGMLQDVDIIIRLSYTDQSSVAPLQPSMKQVKKDLIKRIEDDNFWYESVRTSKYKYGYRNRTHIKVEK